MLAKQIKIQIQYNKKYRHRSFKICKLMDICVQIYLDKQKGEYL